MVSAPRELTGEDWNFIKDEIVDTLQAFDILKDQRINQKVSQGSADSFIMTICLKVSNGFIGWLVTHLAQCQFCKCRNDNDDIDKDGSSYDDDGNGNDYDGNVNCDND